MGDLRENVEDVGEEIHIGILADEGAKASDQDLIRFEESFRQLQLQQRLTLEAEVRRNKFDELRKIGVVDNPQDLVDKVLKATLKRDESSQIHLICQKAITSCQLSLSHQKEGSSEANIKYEDELASTSVELMKVIVENLKLSHELNALDGKLRGLHQEIRQVERESNELKKNPEATAGTKSERIAKLESQYDKACGRYDFSRFLTQLLLMATEEDLNSPKIFDLFLKCGVAADD